MNRASSLLLLLLCTASTAASQIRDDFSDGDLTVDPAWAGDLQFWHTGTLEGSEALQTNGSAETDTIYLAIETDAAFGRWEFKFAHKAVNLSTFNGTRIFLTAIGRDPSGSVEGYFVQFGTNNSDRVSLWRVDGELSNRVELARSMDPLVEGDSSLLHVVVERDAASNWVGVVDGNVIFEASDARYTSGDHFWVWVKHTSQGARSFFMDDLVVHRLNVPPPPPQPVPYVPGPRDIVINEIQFDPLPGSSEFVELYNRSDSTIDLRTLTFRDSRSPPLEVADSTSLIEPGSYAVIVADHEAFEGQFRRTPYIQPSRWAALNNGGDRIVIEAAGEVVDSVSYQDDASPTGFALERIDPDGPSDPYNFTPSRAPFGATPGVLNSTYEPDISGPTLLFAEQIDAKTLHLYLNEPLNVASLTLDGVRVGSMRPDSLALLDDRTFALYLPAEPVSNTVEISGATDRRGNLTNSTSAQIAYVAARNDVVINEIMFEPVSDAFDGHPNQSEYVELLNRSDRRITLSGLYATRRPNESGDADTLDVSLRMSSLDPGAMGVIAGDSGLSSVLPSDVVLIASSLTLPNAGDAFRLQHISGAVIDSVYYEKGLHHPDLVETRGVALERIDPHGPGNDPNNWASSVDPSGGTPGRPNSVRLGGSTSTGRSGIRVAPNPFSPDHDGRDDIAAIQYSLPREVSLVRVRVFDHRGYLVRELVRAQLVGRSGTVYWDGYDDLGRRLRRGIYVVLFEAIDGRRDIVEAFKTAIVLAR